MRSLILFISLVIFCFDINGQNVGNSYNYSTVYSIGKVESSILSHGKAVLHLVDPYRNIPEFNPGLQYVATGGIVSSVSYTLDSISDIPNNYWSVEAIVELVGMPSDSIIVIDTLFISNDTNTAVFHDFFITPYDTTISDTSFNLNVTGLNKISAGGQVPADILFELGFCSERVDLFENNKDLNPTLNVQPGYLEVNWCNANGAEFYEMDYAFVDLLETFSGDPFDRKVRIETNKQSYKIPLTYSNGIMRVRVRAIGIDIDNIDKKRYIQGVWSTEKPATISGFQDSKNWQTSKSFAEEGKTKVNVNYLDDSYRSRQNVIGLNTENRVLISETDYDAEGREAVKIIPTPSKHIDSYNLNYRSNHNQALNFGATIPYSYLNFDKESADPLLTLSGSSGYYSPANNLNGIHNDFIPNAEQYPLIHTKYKRDNSGRVTTQGGVGPKFQVDDDHATRYYYGTPSQTELDRLFGAEIGKAKHYKKNVTVDANGQSSIVYADMYGQTVATAMTGATPNNVVDIDERENSNLMVHSLVTGELIEGESIQSKNKRINIIENTMYNYKYILNGDDVQVLNNICVACPYVVDIFIEDECGDRIDFQDGINVSGTDYFHNYNVENNLLNVAFDINQVVGDNCQPSPSQVLQIDISVVFQEVGEYTIVKRLSLAKAKHENLKSIVETIIDIDEIRERVVEIYDRKNCARTCDEWCDIHATEIIDDPAFDYDEADRAMLVEECKNAICDLLLIDHLSEANRQNCENGLLRIRDQLGQARPDEWTTWADYSTLLGGSTCIRNGIIELEIRDINGDRFTCMAEGANLVCRDHNGSQIHTNILINCEDNVITLNNLGPNGYSWQDLENILANIECWQDNWGENLETCHREYCVYTHCRLWEESNAFTFSLMQHETWNEAAAAFCGTVPCQTIIISNNDLVGDIRGMIDNILLLDIDLLNTAGIQQCTTELIDQIDDYLEGFHSDFKEPIEDGIHDMNLSNPQYDLAEYIAYIVLQKEEVSNRDFWWEMIHSTYSQIKNEVYWECAPNNCVLDNVLYQLFEKPEVLRDPDLGVDKILERIDEVNEGERLAICNDMVEEWRESYRARFSQQTVPPDIDESLGLLCGEICEPLISTGCYEDLDDCVYNNIELTDLCDDMDVKTINDPNIPVQNEAKELLYYQSTATLVDLNGNVPAFLNNPILDGIPSAHYSFAFQVQGNLDPLPSKVEQRVRINIIPKFCNNNGGPLDDPYGDLTSNLHLAIFPVECDGGNVQYVNNPSCEQHFKDINKNVFYNRFGGISLEWTHINSAIGCYNGIHRNYVMVVYRKQGVPGNDEREFVFEINANYELQQYSLIQNNYNHVKKPILSDIYNNMRSAGFSMFDAKDYLDSIWNCEQTCFDLYDPDQCFTEAMGWIMASLFAQTYSGDICTTVPIASTGCYPETQIVLCDDTITRRSELVFLNPGGSIFLQFVNEYGSVIDLANTRILSFTTTEVPSGWIYGDDQLLNTTYYPRLKFLFLTEPDNIIDGIGNECEYLDGEPFIHTGYLIIRQKPNEYNLTVDLDCSPEILNDCFEQIDAAINDEVERIYADSINEAVSRIVNSLDECLQEDQELFSVDFNDHDYQYTLYYYDQVGNLIKTIPPEGVKPLDNSRFIANNGEMIDPSELPNHEMVTEYSYNSLNSLLTSTTPDAGLVENYYDDAQRLRLTVDAHQKLESTATYFKYDDLNRVIETGTVDEQDPENADLNDANYPTMGRSHFYEHQYDEIDVSSIPGALPFEQENLRGRMSYSEYRPDETTNDILEQAYSYDEHGNVNQYASYQEDIGWKSMVYDYDLISGNVKCFSLQSGEVDQYHIKYHYDLDNRLERVFSSKDEKIWEQEARYYYYLHGPLARIELGHDIVQGVDYSYTLQGWLKSVNQPGFNHFNIEPGRDGADNGMFSDNLNFLVPRDVFSFSLGYYQNNDYLPIGLSVDLGANVNAWDDMSPSILGPSADKGLFNGNIAYMITDLNSLTFDRLNAMAYQYDQLHRIKNADSYINTGEGWAQRLPPNGFDVDLTYSRNGNIQTLNRYGLDGQMDGLEYFYSTNTNKLINTEDVVNNNSYFHDIDDYGQTDYMYDERGNIIQDLEGLTSIEWYDFGKVEEIDAPGGLVVNYIYDSQGNRIIKSKTGPENNKLVYLRDPSGNVVSIYKAQNGNVDQTEIPLYGSSRLGVHHINRENITNAEPTARGITRATKRYELTNHLGNVLTTISDRRQVFKINGQVQYVQAEVISAQDYYPFGLEMLGANPITPSNPYSGRSYINPAFQGDESYRYGFNNKERDPDFHEDVTHYDYGARIYNSGIARWLSVDPLTRDFPSWNPYHYVHNDPVRLIDPTGMSAEEVDGNPSKLFLTDKFEKLNSLQEKIDEIELGSEDFENEILVGLQSFQKYNELKSRPDDIRQDGFYTSDVEDESGQNDLMTSDIFNFSEYKKNFEDGPAGGGWASAGGSYIHRFMNNDSGIESINILKDDRRASYLDFRKHSSNFMTIELVGYENFGSGSQEVNIMRIRFNNEGVFNAWKHFINSK